MSAELVKSQRGSYGHTARELADHQIDGDAGPLDHRSAEAHVLIQYDAWGDLRRRGASFTLFLDPHVVIWGQTDS